MGGSREFLSDFHVPKKLVLSMGYEFNMMAEIGSLHLSLYTFSENTIKGLRLNSLVLRFRS
jgi:hypothetical protein